MRLVPAAAQLALLLVAACAPPESVAVQISEEARAAPEPQLGATASFDAALASAGPDVERLDAASAGLAERATALRARAAALGAPVIDPGTRERLEAATP